MASATPTAASYHTSPTALQASFQNTFLEKPSALVSPLVGPAVAIVSLAAAGFVWIYRRDISYRLKLLREESWLFGAGVTMERVDIGGLDADSKMFANLKLLELNPDFVKDCEAKGWTVYSLGDYMSSLASPSKL